MIYSHKELVKATKSHYYYIKASGFSIVLCVLKNEKLIMLYGMRMIVFPAKYSYG